MTIVQQRVITLIETFLPINVSIDGDGDLSWSEFTESSDALDLFIDILNDITNDINELGFDVLIQDDSEYFGAKLTLRRPILSLNE